MNISLSFWVFSITIAIIKIILSSTVGALFAFYARHSHDRYANSIRWSRIGGFFEMVALFKNSRGKVLTRTRIAMTLMIFASLSTLFVSILLGGIVSPADKGVQPNQAESPTEQLVYMDPLFFWTAFMESDATMEETLIATLNDTQRNPTPIPKTRYTPRTYDYETVCDESSAYFGKDFYVGLIHPPLPLKCKLTVATLNNNSYIWEPLTAIVNFISSSVVLVAAPTRYVNEPWYRVPRLAFDGIERHICRRASFVGLDTTLGYFPKDGIISLPKTEATKCQYGSDESISMAATFIDFAVNRLSGFDRATTDAAEYLVSLGHNVFVNSTGRTESEGLYILYDTVKLEDAFEVPTLALFVLLAVVAACAIAWGISEVFYKLVYNGSLYKVIFREIESKKETTPMLMTCAYDSLAFEGNQLVPLNGDEHPDG
ncbi:hypothetical protein BGZ47_005781 [Haplosporangium gracile]|nr:hypothetical protein BGZ47_005781 [Haplosporangium gracile]